MSIKAISIKKPVLAFFMSFLMVISLAIPHLRDMQSQRAVRPPVRRNILTAVWLRFWPTTACS